MSRRRLLRYVLPLLVVLLVLGGLGGIKASQIGLLMAFAEQAQAAGPPPEVVGTAPAALVAWERTMSAVASVVSAKGLALRNEVAGVVTRIHFDSGDSVRKGKVLLELDSKVERAELRSVRARRQLAALSLERSQALLRSGAIPQATVDADAAEFKRASAEAAALAAQIERKTVRSPFAGKLGIREVDVGQYLAPGTRITLLESTETFYVDFTLPQENLDLLEVGMPVRVSAARPTEAAQNSEWVQGTIAAVEPALDAATRAVGVRAVLDSDGERLRSGMFVRVDVVLPERRDVVAIPLTAVVSAPYGDSVFLVESEPGPNGEPQRLALQQFVRLGEERGDFVAVLEGINAGQEVVSAGAFKLRNRAPIVIDNSVKPEPALRPKLENR